MATGYFEENVMGSLRAQTELQRKGNRIARAQLAVMAIHGMNVHRHLDQLHGEMDEQTEALHAIDRQLQRQTRRHEELHEELMGGIDRQTAVLERSAEVAADQRFAQWRDGTEVGRKYFYEYRPAAKAYLAAYLRMSELWRAQVMLEVRRRLDDFDSWRRPEWLPGAPETGRFLAPPPRQLPADVDEDDLRPIRVPARPYREEISPRKKSVSGLLSLMAILMLSVFLVSISEGPFSEALFPLIASCFFGAYPAYLWWRWKEDRRALEEWRAEAQRIEAENQRRAHLRMLAEQDRNAHDRWMEMNRDCHRQMTVMLCEYLGMDLGADWSEEWATPQERALHETITAVIANEREKPPALTEHYAPGTLALQANMRDQLLHPLQRFRGQQLAALPGGASGA